MCPSCVLCRVGLVGFWWFRGFCSVKFWWRCCTLTFHVWIFLLLEGLLSYDWAISFPLLWHVSRRYIFIKIDTYLFVSIFVRGFHRTFASGATCRRRTLTPPDTLGLVCVLILRPISPELVLFSDIRVSTSLGTSVHLQDFFVLSVTKCCWKLQCQVQHLLNSGSDL